MSAASPSMSKLFSNRFIQAILLSGLCLQIGIWVRNFAILLFVMEQTNENEFAVSMIYVAEYAPIFLFSFIGGTFADRWRPKRTMIWCDVLSALSVFAVLVVLMLGMWKAVFFATLISATLSQFSQPSGMKLFKLHVPDEFVQMGMSIYQTMFAVFMILGPVIGTFIYQQYGIQTAVAIVGVAFFLSAVVLLLLPPDRVEERSASTRLSEEMASGFKYVLSNKILTVLSGCFAIAGFALGFIQPLGIFLVTEQLGLPKEHLQWFLIVNGAGMMVGGGLIMALSKKLAPQYLLALGMTANALGIIVMGLSSSLWLSLAAQLVCGLLLPGIHIGINTLILRNTASDFVGRVNGILNPLFMGSMVLTMMMSGWLKEQFSLVAMYELAGILFIIGVIAISPLYRRPLEGKERA